MKISKNKKKFLEIICTIRFTLFYIYGIYLYTDLQSKVFETFGLSKNKILSLEQ